MPVDRDYIKKLLRDPEQRSCGSCRHVCCNINDEPCRACIHTDPPGRSRPMWEYRANLPGMPEVWPETQVKTETGGQMRLF